MFDPAQREHRLLAHHLIFVFQGLDEPLKGWLSQFDQRIGCIIFEFIAPQLLHERIEDALVPNLAQGHDDIFTDVPVPHHLDQHVDGGRPDLAQRVDRHFANLPIAIVKRFAQRFHATLIAHFAQGNRGFAADDPIGILQEIDLNIDLVFDFFFFEHDRFGLLAGEVGGSLIARELCRYLIR
jgi:hypothetical protein